MGLDTILDVNTKINKNVKTCTLVPGGGCVGASFTSTHAALGKVPAVKRVVLSSV